jgi:WD40 repeat protein
MPERYDGFISYSHAADDLLAPRLQAGLQRFAKPWWRRRALRVFRDESSLSANPHLWSSITDALDGSEWFVLLLSEDAAQSEWVNQEISYWVEHKDPSRILPVVTDGEFGWADGDISVSSTAAPPALSGVFTEEPRWVDLRWARTDEQLDLSNPRFSDAVADIASAIRGVAKDELESEEVRQHRRTIRTAWAAGVVVLLLAVAAAIGAVVAVGQSNEAQDQRDEAQRQTGIAEANAEEAKRQEEEAERQAENARQQEEEAREAEAEALENEQKALEAQAATEVERDRADEQAGVATSRELAAAAVAVLDDDPELSIMLALESIKATPEGREASPQGVIALRQGMAENRLAARFAVLAGVGFAAISPDGSTLYHAASFQTELYAFDVESGSASWVYAPETVDEFHAVAVSPDGGLVAVGVIDVPDRFGPPDLIDENGNDAHPPRVVVLDASTGEVMQVLVVGECALATVLSGFSPDGAYLGVGTGPASCGISRGGYWLDLYDTATWEVVRRFELPDTDGIVHVRFSDDMSRVLIFANPFAPAAELRSFPDLELINTFPQTGWAALSPDGRSVAHLRATGTDPRPVLVDAESGDLISHLDTGAIESAFPIEFSPDGRMIVVTTSESDHIFDAETGAKLHTFRASGFEYSQGFTAAGDRLFTTSDEGPALWNIDRDNAASGDALTVPGVEMRWMNPNTVVDGPQLALVTFLDDGRCCGAATVFLDRTTLEVTEWFVGEATVQLPDGRLVAWEFEPIEVDGELDRTEGPTVIWDPDTGERTVLEDCQVINSELAHECYVTAGVFASPDGSVLATEAHIAFDMPNLFRIYDTTNFEALSDFELHRSKWLLNIGPDWMLFFDSVGNRLALRRMDGELITPLGDQAYMAHATVSRDGSLLVVSSLGGALEIYDTTTWDLVARWRAHTAVIRGYAFSDDQMRLVTTGTDDFVNVWDLSGLSDLDLDVPPPLLDRIPARLPSDAAWLSESELAVFMSVPPFAGVEIQLVSLEIDDVVTEALQALTRGFSLEECAVYQIEDCPMTLEEIRSRG